MLGFFLDDAEDTGRRALPPKVGPADRQHLKRLAADSRMIEHWNEIQRFQPRETWLASPGWLIWHVLVARRAAEFFGDYPEKQRHAENVENLAKYLKAGGRN